MKRKSAYIASGVAVLALGTGVSGYSMSSRQTVGSSAGSASTTSTPTVITVQLQANTGPASSAENKSLVSLTNQYEKLHPNVKVQFLANSYTSLADSNANLLTKAAAHSAPDIVWEQYGVTNGGSLPKGILMNLYSYLNKPNPYIAGNKKWISAWEPAYAADMKSSPGQIYVLLGSSIATGIVYNKADFKKAGIASPPKTFAEWIADMKKLQKIGIKTPFMFTTGGTNNPSWFERIVNSSLLAPYVPKFDVDHNTFLSGLDFAVGIEKGIISMKNPAYAEGWKLLAELKPFMAPGSSQYDISASQTAVSPPLSPFTPFVQNKFAMMWVHTGMLASLNNLGFSGKYGIFTFPQITKATTKYATGANTTGIIGGPNGAGEWSVTTPQANASMTPAKTKQVINYLMFLYTPSHLAALINDMSSGAFIPLMKEPSSVKTDALTAPLLPKGKEPDEVDGITDDAVSTAAGNQGLRLIQAYLSSSITFDQFSTQWESLLQQAAQQWAQSNGVNLNKYK